MSAPFEVEAVDLAGAARHSADWAALIARALEPNVFLEPEFALPAAACFPVATRPRFILVWAKSGSAARHLVALCPLSPRRGWFGRMASIWFHDFAPLGGPLLDRDEAGPAWRAVLAFIARTRPGCAALVLRALPADGPTFARLTELALTTGRAFEPIARWQRAALRGERTSGTQGLSKRRRKDMARQRRRLGEQGLLAYVSTRDGAALGAAIELFLELEAMGWKGAGGTAMLARPAQAAFARHMMQALAAAGKCRIDALYLGESPLAMGIVLSSGGHDYFWKMAYAETLAQFSPGVQFVADLTAAQQARTETFLTDSCAIPDHPMIDRLWQDRRPFADMVLALQPGPARLSYRAVVAGLHAARRLKARIKRLLHDLRSARAG